ncbi:MAG: hypothetical protein RL038_215 [Actinomycetota bacterium]
MQDVEFGLVPGDKVLLTGENGSGKSTLLQYLAGNSFNQSSHLEFKGLPFATLSTSEQAKIRHVVFQTDIPYPKFSVIEFLEIAISISQSSTKKLQQIPDIFGTRDLETRFLQSLSGGEWMRVRIAVAWLTDAEIFLLDEADAALDTNYRKEIFKFLLESEKTLVAISHNPEIKDLNWPRKIEIIDQRLVQL